MKTKLTICKYFKHVWKCFVWHRDAHWQIIYRVGVFRLIFNRRDLTNTHDILALTACVQKRMAESRVTLRGDIPNRWRSFSSDIRKKWKVRHESPVGVFHPISGHQWKYTKHEWECFNRYQDTKKFLKRVATHFPRRFRCFEILFETRHL